MSAPAMDYARPVRYWPTRTVRDPRAPVMGFSQASKLMVQTGWCGIYLAVRKPGTLAAGEAFELIPGPREVGIIELFKARMKKA